MDPAGETALPLSLFPRLQALVLLDEIRQGCSHHKLVWVGIWSSLLLSQYRLTPQLEVLLKWGVSVCVCVGGKRKND